MRTNGLSPKAAAAGLITALGTVATVGVLWLVTGTFDKAEITTALTGLIGALVAFASAYLAPPGDVVKPPVGEASDGNLSAKAVKRLTAHDEKGAVENALAFACLIVIVALLLAVAFHSPLWLLVLILIVLLFA